MARPAPRRASAATSPQSQLQGYLHHHRQTLRASLQRLASTPLQTALTLLVVAIALALPATLYTAVANLQQVAGDIDTSARMTVFVDKAADSSTIDTLLSTIKTDDTVASADYISREQALAEFREHSGFGDVLDLLDDNPLPAVIQVQPRNSQPDQIQALSERLSALASVDEVSVDMAWLQRLQGLLDAARTVTLALAIALGLGVLLVMGNTIRLAIENRRDEIVVVKLIGGTDSYMRRPFLYTGLWYGLGGGIVAWLLVWGGIAWVGVAINRLAAAYQSSFDLAGPGFGVLLTLSLCGALLGLGGAWLAVAQHARAIEPE